MVIDLFYMFYVAAEKKKNKNKVFIFNYLILDLHESIYINK